MNDRTRRTILLGVLLTLLSACSSRRSEASGAVAASVVTSSGVRIEDAQMREGLPGVEDGVLYLTLRNTGSVPVRLVSGRSPIAREVVPMADHAHHDAQTPDTALAPGQRLVFSPGGAHLMLMDLTRPPKVGERIEVTLRFDPGGDVTLRVPVNPY